MARRGKAEKQIEAIVKRLSDSVSGSSAIERVMREEAGRILQDAASDWPVKTGISKAALKINVGVRRDVYVVAIINDAAHTWYIKARNLKGKNPFRYLIQRPGRRQAKRVGAALHRAGLEAMNG